MSTLEQVVCPKPRRHLLRRLAGAFGFLFFSYPYVIVTLPLAVYLIVHVILSAPRVSASYQAGDRSTLVGCLPLVLAIFVFAVLTITYAVLQLVQGWRGTARRNGKTAE